MSYKKFNSKKINNYFKNSKLLKNNFDFLYGEGLIQLDIKNFFNHKDCKEIYKKFSSNLNWIVRDSQILKVKKNQHLIANRLINFMKNIITLLQKNIPEKKHIHLNLETLRVARSDGTQHQVGSRWHQDHEAYFTVVINLTQNNDPNSSTRYFVLNPNEKYELDKLGNPIIKKSWKENFIKPFHLGILNSGLRYFLFPHDKCRPIVHHAPKLNNKRLAIFATFSISGIEQGMDLKDIYLPFNIKNNNNLKELRKYWRKILGINESILSKNVLRLSKSKFGLYSLDSTKIDLTKFEKKKEYLLNQPRIVNFGFRQFFKENFIKNKTVHKATFIGELSRSLNFFSNISDHVLKYFLEDKSLNLKRFDCSISGNNNYDLFVLFDQPKKAFQLLNMDEIKKNIRSFILILHPKSKNLFYKKKLFKNFDSRLPFERKNSHFKFNFKDKANYAQMFTSFKLNKSISLKNSLLMFHAFNYYGAQEKKMIVKQNNSYLLINKKNLNRFINKKVNKKSKRSFDKVPFFLPRVGINRILPDINSNSKIFKKSINTLSI